jgi:signal transduction histidine kinase
MLCIDRAQRLAVQEERLRIAQDIHDTVSQSLFGIVYTLDGSLKLLPEQPDVVIPELERALRVAEETHQEVRQSILNIWPTEITADRFIDGLRKYTNNVCKAKGLRLIFDMNGDFERLSPQARRGLYRIAQETLANAAHHAAASEVTISLDVTADQATLSIQDNGQGFEPSSALAREYDREHFGLRGMRERARSLGGSCEIHSQLGSGASILVDIPLSNNTLHE